MMQTSVTISFLEDYLRLTSSREQVIASNMANIDTPGYRTRDIDFSKELDRAMQANEDGASSLGSHPRMEPTSYEVRGLMERADGNNIDLDREGMLLAEVQLQHQLGVQLVKSYFHTLLTAIDGGA